MKKYPVISDPGHAWIAVPLAELEQLGILDQISTCSYQMGATVYLEEDCDGSLWFNAMNAQGNPPAFVQHFQDPCPIRSYPHFVGHRAIPRATYALHFGAQA